MSYTLSAQKDVHVDSKKDMHVDDSDLFLQIDKRLSEIRISTVKKVKSFVVSDKKIFSCFPLKAYVTLDLYQS